MSNKPISSLRSELHKIVYKCSGCSGEHTPIENQILELIASKLPKERTYLPPKDTADHWGLRDESLTRMIDNNAALGFNDCLIEVKRLLGKETKDAE